MKHKEIILAMLGRITIYQNAVIFILFLWGIYAMLADEPATYVSRALPQHIYLAWIGIHIFAPLVIWVGQLSEEPRVEWPLRLVGDCALALMTPIYLIGLVVFSQPVNTRGDAIYQGIMFVGFGLCALGLAARDALRYARSEGRCKDKV